MYRTIQDAIELYILSLISYSQWIKIIMLIVSMPTYDVATLCPQC